MRKWLNMLILAVLLYVSFVTYVQFMRHLSFNSYYFDLGVYTRKIWALTQGWFDNVLAGHLEPFLILLLPFYYLFPSPLTIIFIQALFVSSASVILFFIAKKYTTDFQAFILSVIYLAYTPLLYTSLYDFHTISFAIFFILLSVYFYEKKNWKAYSISNILLLLIREDVALTVLFINVYYWLKYRQKIAVYLAVFAVLYFLFYLSFEGGTSISTPSEYGISRYGYLGSSVSNIIFNVIKNPLILFSEFNYEKLKYLFYLFAPLLFLPLFNRFIITAIPSFAINLLSRQPSDYVVTNHHSSLIIPLLFVSLIYSLRRFREKTWILGLSLFLTVLLSFYLLVMPNKSYISELSDTSHAENIKIILDQLPKGNYSVSAEQHIYLHLIYYNELHVLPPILEFRAPDEIMNTDYVVLDAKLPKLDYYTNKSNLLNYINKYKTNNCFEIVDERDGVVLFRNIC